MSEMMRLENTMNNSETRGCSFSSFPLQYRQRLWFDLRLISCTKNAACHKASTDFTSDDQPWRFLCGRPPSGRIFGRHLTLIVVIAATAGIIFSYQVSTTSESTAFPDFSLVSTIKHFVTSGSRELDGEDEDRVNLLLMGIGGEGHDGPQLTDTIIFASYQPSTGAIGMMSLPRDMSVPIPEYGYSKVNHANAYGEMNEPGSGPALASQVIGDVLSEDIQYYLRVDFDGFAEFVDAIGGVDVYVDNSFTDPNYPTLGREYDSCG